MTNTDRLEGILGKLKDSYDYMVNKDKMDEARLVYFMMELTNAVWELARTIEGEE